MYLGTMLFLKTAILLEWARIFGPGSRKSFRWACYITAGLNDIYYLINIILDCIFCAPRKVPSGYCSGADVLLLVSAIVNLVSDLAILLLPQGVIWRLNMSRKKRVGVSIMFLIGLVYAPFYIRCPFSSSI